MSALCIEFGEFGANPQKFVETESAKITIRL